MASIQELQVELENLQASYQDVRPFLVQYLSQDMVEISNADHVLVLVEKFLAKTAGAENRRHTLRAFWWYAQALKAMRRHGKLLDGLGERGLQAQAKAQ